jgi:dTDP-4-dehydrorhamnose 3,5-epimerase
MQILGAERVTKDRQSVTPDGKPVFRLIQGVSDRPLITHSDQRGTTLEIYNPSWNFDAEPLVYVYQASLLPGYVKGWVVHLHQDDRLALNMGRLRVVLFDGRKGSPTEGQLNHFEGGDSNRRLLLIPAGVYHAVQNIGSTEAFFVNMPTQPYRHDDPDKFRLPLDNDLIPYRFSGAQGW